MSKAVIHSKPLPDHHFRELTVDYDKGGISYWDYKTYPKGIYLRSTVVRREPGSNFSQWKTGQAGDGRLCIVELDNYRPSVLKAVRARVEADAALVHYLIEGGHVATLKGVLSGELPRDAALTALAADLVEEVA